MSTTEGDQASTPIYGNKYRKQTVDAKGTYRIWCATTPDDSHPGSYLHDVARQQDGCGEEDPYVQVVVTTPRFTTAKVELKLNEEMTPLGPVVAQPDPANKDTTRKQRVQKVFPHTGFLCNHGFVPQVNPPAAGLCRLAALTRCRAHPLPLRSDRPHVVAVCALSLRRRTPPQK